MTIKEGRKIRKDKGVPRTSKFRLFAMAIKNLQPGCMLEIRTSSPKSLINYIYKHSLKGEGIRIQRNKIHLGMLLIYNENPVKKHTLTDKMAEKIRLTI